MSQKRDYLIGVSDIEWTGLRNDECKSKKKVTTLIIFAWCENKDSVEEVFNWGRMMLMWIKISSSL